MGNRITLTQVNYVRKADETSSVAIMSQTPRFDVTVPPDKVEAPWHCAWVNIELTLTDNSRQLILHLKTHEGSFTLRLTSWERRRKVGRKLQSFIAFPSYFDALRSPCDNELMLSTWTRSFSHARWCR